MKVLISGAGIGGLTAALCLEQAGHDVELFEQAQQFSEIGAGIQCGANALKVMDHLGLLTQLEALAVAPERAEFCDHASAEILYTAPFGNAYRTRYGAPYLHILRADLVGVLLAAFRQRKANGMHLGAQVTHYTEQADGVQAHFADGSIVNGDCLIAADGIRSKIRSQLVGAIEPRFTGNVAWRGVLPADQLPANFMQKVVRNFVGPNKHMVIYYLRQQQLVNFVGVVENKGWQDDSWVSKAPWEELKADFEGWHPMVQAVIDGMSKDECYRWALFDHKPIKRWSSDRVTLLGDAAHATLPFMASGAAMAIEDGRILQRALDQASDIKQGLALYQANRFKRTKEIQNSSRQLGKLYHINNRLALKLAFKALDAIGKRKERFLPEYDANTVELL